MKISLLFPEYARLSDGLRTGAIPSTPENEAAHDRAFANMCASRKNGEQHAVLAQNGWANVPVATSCWEHDAQYAERE